MSKQIVVRLIDLAAEMANRGIREEVELVVGPDLFRTLEAEVLPSARVNGCIELRFPSFGIVVRRAK